MFPPIQTGTSHYSSNLALALTSRKHNVTVVTLRVGAEQQDACGFPVTRLPALHIPMKNFFKYFNICSIYPGNFIRLARIANEAQADAVLLVNHYLDIAFPAIFAARRRGIPLICSVGTQLQSSNPRSDWILNFLDRLICGRMVFPFCDRIIAWDEEILRYLKDVHHAGVLDKTVIINYGVNGDISFLLEHNHDYGPHNQLLGVGAVIEQRSFVPLVKAFHALSHEFPLLKLKIVGHIYHDAAVKLATELGLAARVMFTGELPHDNVLDEMRKSDLFFSSLTARYVGLGTATIESMLLGVPTVANVYPTLLGKARLADLENIALCGGASPEEIADKIRLLLKEQALREKIGKAGREFIRKNLDWDKIASEIEALILEVI